MGDGFQQLPSHLGDVGQIVAVVGLVAGGQLLQLLLGGVLTLSDDKVGLCDGRFELLLVRAPKDLIELAECVQALQRQTYNCSMITFQSARKVRVFANPFMPWTLDGEYGGVHQTVDICMHQRALTFMVPEDMEKKNKPQGPKKQENDLDIRLLPEYNRGT